MSDTRRSKRMASLLKEVLSKVLLQEVSDPYLREILVTDVDLSTDLKHAKIYYSKNNSNWGEKDLAKGFERANSFIKRRISEELDVRYVPELRFIQDNHTENLTHLFSVMDQIKEGSHS